jgi:hypothetical protein
VLYFAELCSEQYTLSRVHSFSIVVNRVMSELIKGQGICGLLKDIKKYKIGVVIYRDGYKYLHISRYWTFASKVNSYPAKWILC